MDFKRFGFMEGSISVILNLLLSCVKFWLAVVAGSVAMMADAWYTLSDTLTSFVLVIGIRFADRGHGRRVAEPVAGIIIGTVIAAVGASFLYESVSRIFQNRSVVYQPVSMVIFAVAVVLKEALAQFAFWGARKDPESSGALVAEGWHHRTEAIAAALIVAGFFFTQTFWWLDEVLGIAVSVLILFTSYDNIKEAVLGLTGRPCGEPHKKKVMEIVKKEAGTKLEVTGITEYRYNTGLDFDLHVRSAGPDVLTALENVRARLKEELRCDVGVIVDVRKNAR